MHVECRDCCSEGKGLQDDATDEPTNAEVCQTLLLS